MSEISIDEVRDAVEKATDKSTFSLVEAIKGRGYPTEEVTVYLNADAAYNLAEVNELLTKLAQGEKQDTEAYDNLDAVAQQLAQELRDSEVTFYLRGISPGELQKITKKVRKQADADGLDEDEISLALTDAWIAPHIIKTEDANGNVEERLYAPEDVTLLRDLLPQTEWLKLDTAINKLSFSSAYFDQVADAGFLSKS
jgi:hypothetical protein